MVIGDWGKMVMHEFKDSVKNKLLEKQCIPSK